MKNQLKCEGERVESSSKGKKNSTLLRYIKEKVKYKKMKEK